MSPSRILTGLFLIVPSIMGLAMWGAAQWVEHALGDQIALGEDEFDTAKTRSVAAE